MTDTLLSALTRAEKAEADLRQCRMQALADAAQDQMRAEALEADRVKVAETALRMAADLPSYDSDGDPAGQFDHHIFVKRNAILAIIPPAVLAAVDSTCNPE